MKRSFICMLALCATLLLSACDNVPAGYVGVKVDKYGDDRGVQAEVLKPGRYFTGINTTIFEFPTFTQTDKWQEKSSADEKAPNQSITFQASGGIAVNTDIGISFHVDPANVPKVFQKYRRGIDEISDNFLRNMVRDELNTLGIKYDVESLQGTGKEDLLKHVEANVKAKAAEIGVTVEDLSYLSGLRFPGNVVAAINAKIQATQDAMRIENEVRQTKAQAEKQVVSAEAQVKVAEAEARAMKLRGDALRANSDVLRIKELDNQAEAIKKWDGKLPTYSGGNAPVPFISVK